MKKKKEITMFDKTKLKKMKKALSILTATIMLIITIAGASADINDGVVSYYTFDSNANDATGTNNGSVTGATNVNNASCLTNGCYFWDGSNDDIDFNAEISNYASQTISMWISWRNVNRITAWIKPCDLGASIDMTNIERLSQSGAYNYRHYVNNVWQITGNQTFHHGDPNQMTMYTLVQYSSTTVI